MKVRNERKAKILYDYLDQSKMFHGTVRKRGSLDHERTVRDR